MKLETWKGSRPYSLVLKIFSVFQPLCRSYLTNTFGDVWSIPIKLNLHPTLSSKMQWIGMKPLHKWHLTTRAVLDLLLKPSEIFQKVKGEPFFPLSNFLIASNCLSDMYVGVLSSSSSTYFYQHLQYCDKLFCARNVVYICSWNVTDFCPTFLPTSQRSGNLISPTLCVKMQMCQHIQPIFATAPTASKYGARFKSGLSWFATWDLNPWNSL